MKKLVEENGNFILIEKNSSKKIIQNDGQFFLMESERAISILIDEFIKRFVDKENQEVLKINKPQIKTRKLKNVLGTFTQGENLITIDTNIVHNFDELKKTLWHELIHWVIWHTDNQNYFANNGHGPSFIAYMEKINKAEGEKIINIKSVGAMKGGTTKKYYYTYILKDLIKDIYYIFNMNKENNDIGILNLIEVKETENVKDYEFYVFKNNDLLTMQQIKTITSKLKWVTILNPETLSYKIGLEESAILKKIYDNLKNNENNFIKLEDKIEYWVYAIYDKTDKKEVIEYFWSVERNSKIEKKLKELQENYEKNYNRKVSVHIFKTDNEILSHPSIKIDSKTRKLKKAKTSKFMNSTFFINLRKYIK